MARSQVHRVKLPRRLEVRYRGGSYSSTDGLLNIGHHQNIQDLYYPGAERISGATTTIVCFQPFPGPR
jgi:hypothetical protein